MTQGFAMAFICLIFLTNGALPTELASSVRLFDTALCRQKLRNKCIVFLGDSTMQETMHDLVMLLSGLAADSNLLTDYIHTSTRQNGNTKVCIPSKRRLPSIRSKLLFIPEEQDMFDCAEGVEVHFHGNHRNMTAVVHSLNIVMRLRYTGHVDLHQNEGGTQTFLEADFQPELDYLQLESEV